jgi:hypothetical protein
MTGSELVVGEVLTRHELHQRFGGTPQGGISPSSASGMVLLFTVESPDLTNFTGWGEDKLFHFMGQGLRGDQSMTQGNRSLLRHKEDGRAVHVFHQIQGRAADRRLYRHLGRFELDHETPWYSADAPDADGNQRSVIVFRLRPVGAYAQGGPLLATTPLETPRVVEVSASFDLRERRAVARVPRAQTESRLRDSYAAHLRALGRSVTAAQLTPAGETATYTVDLLDTTENRLIEVKASATRSALREAIGKLLDCRRFFNPTPMLVVLLPSQPRADLLDLCASLCIEVVWPREGGGFVSTHD